MKAKERFAVIDAIERIAGGIKSGTLPASEISGTLTVLCDLFEYGELISLIDADYLQTVKDYGLSRKHRNLPVLPRSAAADGDRERN